MKTVTRNTLFSILAASVGLATAALAAQAPGDIERKVRELGIMDNIFEAALQQESNSGFRVNRIGQTQSMYLAGQGMVFNFRLVNFRPVRVAGQPFGQNFQIYMNDDDALEIAAETLERLELSFPDLDFDFDFDYDFDFDFDNDDARQAGQKAAQQAQQAAQQAQRAAQQAQQQAQQQARVYNRFFVGGDFGPEQEAVRGMEETMRETQDEIRDMQREIRRLERQLRDASGSDADTLRQEMDNIEQRMEGLMANLDEQQQAYEAFLADVESKRREQQAALADEAASQIITTLCDYGATLRTLGNDEHVTIILENYSEDLDQVYVFNYSDIRDCRSPDTLKQGAVSYQM